MTDGSRPARASAFVAVVTTVGSRADAQRIARELVERRLVACAQISEIESVYRWDGRVAQEPEWRLLLKAPASMTSAVMDAVRALHPYRLPALHALALHEVDAAYGAWIEAETQQPG